MGEYTKKLFPWPLAIRQGQGFYDDQLEIYPDINDSEPGVPIEIVVVKDNWHDEEYPEFGLPATTEARANVFLAAPDLFDECEEGARALEYTAEALRAQELHSLAEYCEAQAKKNRAAIRKARGE